MTASATDVLRKYHELELTFDQVERKRVARRCDLLKRVLDDAELREELAGEASRRQGAFPIRTAHPDWAVRLAEVLENPARSATVRCALVDYSRQLYAEAVETSGFQPLAEWLTTTVTMPILSDLARDLLYHGTTPWRYAPASKEMM